MMCVQGLNFFLDFLNIKLQRKNKIEEQEQQENNKRI